MDKFISTFREVAALPDLAVRIKAHRYGAVITFPDGRGQTILFHSEGDRYVLTSVVIGSRRVSNLGRSRLLPLIWERNHETNVVGFNLDRRGRVIGRIEQVTKTVDRDELHYYLELLARECDRFEYLLSGHDTQ